MNPSHLIRRVNDSHSGSDNLSDTTRGTVGAIEYDSVAINMVPDEVQVIWEFFDNDLVEEGYQRTVEEIDQIGRLKSVSAESE